MATLTPARTSRENILDAALRVMERDGAGNLTLEMVAREAGISKGGLLYHFPNKNALLRGLIESAVEEEGRIINERLPKDRRPGDWLKAYLDIQFGIVEKFRPCGDPSNMLYAVMGAAANDPSMLEPIRNAFDRWNAEAIQDGIDPTVALMVRFAAEGVWVAGVLGFAPPDDAQKQKIFDLLQTFTNSTGADATN